MDFFVHRFVNTELFLYCDAWDSPQVFQHQVSWLIGLRGRDLSCAVLRISRVLMDDGVPKQLHYPFKDEM